MRSKRFLSHLISTLSWCLKNNIKSQWEVCIVIKFLLSRRPNQHSGYSLDREKYHTFLTLKRRQNVVHDVINVEKHELPRRDPWMGEPVCSSRKRAQPFLPSHCRSERNQACLPGLLWISSREVATRSAQAAKWARTRNCSRSPNLTPNSNGSGPPTPSSPAAHGEGPKRSSPLVPDTVLSRTVERSLDPGRLQRALRHLRTNGVSPIDLRRLSAFESNWRRGKVLPAFRLHTASPDKYSSLLANQRLSRSGILRLPHCLYAERRSVFEPLAFDLPRVIWWGLL